MVTIPAFAWRGSFLRRALIIGGGVGLCLGALAWLDSGVPVVGAMVLGIVGLTYGVWMPRRMTRYWPGSGNLTGEERVAVVRAARRGERISDERLAQPMIDYARGVHEAAETGRAWRWLLVCVLTVAVTTAVFDAALGSWGNALASAIYLVALVMELFWWPKRQARLLANADRAAALSC